MLIRNDVVTVSGFLETISAGRKHFRLTDNSRKHEQDLKCSKMLIRYDVITTSGSLKTISEGRKCFHLT